MIRLAVCSDISLEGKFQKMSSKKIGLYEEKQLAHFDSLIQTLVKEKPDAFFVVGNLFGTVKPKNNTISVVNEAFDTLHKNGIETFLLPGGHETPLYFAHDIHPLELFRNSPGIHLLLPPSSTNIHSLEISEPVFEGTIKKIPFRIFAPPSTLKSPDLYDYQLETQGKAGKTCEIYAVSDLTAYRKETEKVCTKFFKKMSKIPLSAIFLGGNLPCKVPKKISKSIISCPQIHPNNFKYANSSGLKILTYDPEKKQFIKEKLVPISQLNVERILIHLSEFSPENWDDVIKNALKERSNLTKILQMSLDDVISKDNYHNHLSLYRYLEIGLTKNFHFELEDRIEFDNAAADIGDLNLLNELKKFTKNQIENLSGMTDQQRELEKAIYEKAMQKIEDDYSNFA
jgi:hypothetical protein